LVVSNEICDYDGFSRFDLKEEDSSVAFDDTGWSSPQKWGKICDTNKLKMDFLGIPSGNLT